MPRGLPRSPLYDVPAQDVDPVLQEVKVRYAAKKHFEKKLFDPALGESFEEAERALSEMRNHVGKYSAYVYGLQPARVHRLWNNAMDDIITRRSRQNKLLIIAPPNSAKSTYASIIRPTHYLGNHPDHHLLFFTSSDEMSKTFGSTVRLALDQNARHKAVFPDWTCAPDKKRGWSSDGLYLRGTPPSAKDPAYKAVGFNATIMGARAHGIILDDPLDQKDAISEIEQQKAKNYYTQTIRSRLHTSEGWLLAIMCMTGDTRVLLADGAEKILADIRVGDMVASYHDGRLVGSKVVRWKNQGSDDVFRITMTSGIIAKANERHPFLVDRGGELEWIRLKNLRVGDTILRVIGGNGAALRVPTTGVKSPLRAKDNVGRITQRPDGRRASGLHRITRQHGEMLDFNIDMEFGPLSTMHWSSSNVGAALFVESYPERMSVPIGVGNSASIMTTRLAGSEVCSVTTAISSLAMEKQSGCSSRPLDTFEIVADSIVKIEPAGSEDVFDIQVEDTENFIANGLVSHNTRWHEHDLASYFIELAEQSGEWLVLRTPLLAEESGDLLGRYPGESLWPEQYTPEWTKQTQTGMSVAEFNLVYQGDPTGMGGDIFESESWFQDLPPWFWTEIEPKTETVQAWDLAWSEKDRTCYTVGMTAAVDAQMNIYILHITRQRMTDLALENEMVRAVQLAKPALVGIEESTFHMAATRSLVQRILGRVMCNIQLPKPDKDKITRARLPAGRAQHGKIFVDKRRPWYRSFISECLGFPNTRYKDQVDALSLLTLLVQNLGEDRRNRHGLRVVETAMSA